MPGVDKEVPRFRDVEGVVWHWGGDEHGIIELNNPSKEIALGEKLHVITPHCDPTVISMTITTRIVTA
ncbi:MAG: hypothetical protein U5O39_17645 [Gammaproteobacteria bacterium]|nr:hypothetical protein [Gammaproteobacteria bacterium]